MFHRNAFGQLAQAQAAKAQALAAFQINQGLYHQKQQQTALNAAAMAQLYRKTKFSAPIQASKGNLIPRRGLSQIFGPAPSRHGLTTMSPGATLTFSGAITTSSTNNNFVIHSTTSGGSGGATVHSGSAIYSGSTDRWIDGDALLSHVQQLPIQDLISLLQSRTGRVHLWKGNDYCMTLPDGVTTLDVDNNGDVKIRCQDGTILTIEDKGSFQIDNKNAKVIYKSNNIRNFNPFMNASDKLEDFIRFCGSVGVAQGELMELPMKLFISWLVLEAAKADEEPEPAVPLLEDLKAVVRPKCLQCNGNLPREFKAEGINFCRTACYESYVENTKLLHAIEVMELNGRLMQESTFLFLRNQRHSATLVLAVEFSYFVLKKRC